MKLGYASPSRMLGEMSELDLSLWLGFLRVGSLEDEAMDDATDKRFAMVAAAAMNGPYFTLRDKRPYTPLDFLPKRQERDKDVSQSIRAAFMNRGN